MLVIIVGFVIGVTNVLNQNSSADLYSASVIFLVLFNEVFNYVLRQAIIMESNMLSAERAWVITQLPSESSLTQEYDQ